MEYQWCNGFYIWGNFAFVFCTCVPSELQTTRCSQCPLKGVASKLRLLYHCISSTCVPLVWWDTPLVDHPDCRGASACHLPDEKRYRSSCPCSRWRIPRRHALAGNRTRVPVPLHHSRDSSARVRTAAHIWLRAPCFPLEVGIVSSWPNLFHLFEPCLSEILGERNRDAIVPPTNFMCKMNFDDMQCSVYLDLVFRPSISLMGYSS